jgi:hypothetical protein
VFDARHFAGLSAAFLFLGMAGCQQEPPAVEAQISICKDDAAKTLVGRDRITDDEAKQLTGATIVRQVRPGDPVTMDFRQERVTIETDEKTGKIVRASCG